jgi:glycosyltransferase involved in cell wall biosynthesis
MQPTATVIVSTYNNPRALSRVLRGLADQALPPHQIIIADDGSTESTASVIEAWKTELKNLEHCWQADRGFRKTRILNAAILRVNCDIVIFLDGDCVPFPSFIADHLRHAEPGAVLVGGRILTSPGFKKKLVEGADDSLPNDFSYWLLRFLLGDVDRVSSLLRVPGRFWRFYASRDWRLLRGCNFSVSREALIKVNGFDESYRGWGFEDSDIGVRLINLGMRIKSLRFAAPVLHLWHPEEPRDRAAINTEELSCAIRSGRTHALKGLREHEH